MTAGSAPIPEEEAPMAEDCDQLQKKDDGRRK
jgi:hypothetical protein